jgi:Flp pilus assembly protein TadB
MLVVPLLVATGVLAAAAGLRLRRRGVVRELLGTHARPSGRRRVALTRRDVLVPAAAAVGGFLAYGVIGSALGVGLAVGLRRFERWREHRAAAGRVDEQLADAVGAVAAALRAGMSVPQCLGYTASETPAPLGPALRRLVDEIEVGTPVGEAVRAWADDVDTDDARLLAAALELHRRSGGDLPVVLDQVAATIRDRVAAAREVRALTAQARLSGLILGLLPVGFFAFLWLTSRRDIEGALGTPVGIGSALLGLAMEGAAFVWIRRLLEVA